jgi:hypothetical protein
MKSFVVGCDYERSVFDDDRQCRADGCRMSHIIGLGVGRILVDEKGDTVIVSLIEDGVGGCDTLAGGDALPLVDGNSHGGSPSCTAEVSGHDHWAAT